MAGHTVPGRLRRTLQRATPGLPNTASIFGLYAEPLGTLYDDDIRSVVIHRGKAERGGGHHPATLEVTVQGQYSSSVAGSNVRLFIREPAADALAGYLGTSGAAITDRYTGRLGNTRVHDDGTRFDTTFAAASWLAQMNYSPVHYTPAPGPDLFAIIMGLANAENPNRGINMRFRGIEFGTTVATKQDPALFKDGIGRYAADLGVLLRETRAGYTDIMLLRWRIENAQAQLATQLPLTRSQAISPAEWEQPYEGPGLRVEYKITNATGGIATRVAEIANPTGEQRETLALDWSYMQVADVDNQLYREAYGRVFDATTRLYRVPSVTVDLLHLIGSGKQYHRDQAGQLLRLEHGDPVYFAADWPAPLRGVHMAEGITETITAHSWTLQLSLVPYAIATGDTPTPIVPGRVWDSMGTARWDEQTKKWSAA